ncbi:MAG: asparagine synthetase B, partial [Burkholderiales bacterium]|nr:asparagine synthetase B [Burkholderiales bacterium]
MCGLSGFLSLPLPRDRGRDVLERMGNKLAQRGPDGQGFWLAEDGKVGLVHRRLEVIEPGPKGHQPMLSHSGRYVLIFNGEIYNHKELRTALEAEGMNFRGQSDTEVLIVALEYWGHERALKKLVGMFAFALWDRRKNRLLLSRDRFGEKPLYYGWQNRTFLFGSTTSALRQHPDWIGDVD